MAARKPRTSRARKRSPEGAAAEDAVAVARQVLADPPWFTGGPNPATADWVRPANAAESTPAVPITAPLALDVSAGKNDPIYNDHPYHTKVPYRAIVPYILHFTRPTDVVLDGFCGSGMTGVAAQLCGDRETLASLGLHAAPTGRLRDEAGKDAGSSGARRVVLGDLSPLAGLLAYHHNMPLDADELRACLAKTSAAVESRWGWVQATLHSPTTAQVAQAVSRLAEFPGDPRRGAELPWATIQFVVWSDLFACPECAAEFDFYAAAVESSTGRVQEPCTCPGCGTRLRKRQLKRVFASSWDACLGGHVEQVKQVPVRINYEWQGRRYEKVPDAFDRELWQRLEHQPPPFPVPVDRMPAGRESRRNDVIGLTHVHHFYPPANRWLLAALRAAIREWPRRLRQAGLLVHSAANLYASRLRRFRAGKKGGGPLSGTLYVSSLNTPANALRTFERNAGVLVEAARVLQRMPGEVRVSVQSSTVALAPPESIDYVFVDPPFGGNLMYSELNFLWEAWLGICTDSATEAVENLPCGKTLEDYQRLLTDCFRRFHEVLKPAGWMTVVFHHAERRVWHAVQAAIRDAGFSVRDVRTLDKRQESFKQQNLAGSVKHDLVISALKVPPSDQAGGPLQRVAAEQVWEFVARRLMALPKNSPDDAERSDCLLYSRVVADCVQRGVEVPLSAAEFYAGLRERFREHEGRFYAATESP